MYYLFPVPMRSKSRGGWEMIIDYLLCANAKCVYASKMVFQMHFTISRTISIKIVSACDFNYIINFDAVSNLTQDGLSDDYVIVSY